MSISMARAWHWIAVAAVAAPCALAGVGALAVRTRSLEIVTKSGVHVFSVEMATTLALKNNATALKARHFRRVCLSR
jgi:hypothetical protein